MKLSPILILGIAMALITIGGCKKETAQATGANAKKEQSEKIKSWFYQAKVPEDSKVLKGQKIDWDKTQYFENQKVYSTPFEPETGKSAAQPVVQRTLITTENAEGKITGGKFIIVIPEKNAGENGFSSEAVIADFLQKKEMETTFSGAVLESDLLNNLVSYQKFLNGKKISNTGKNSLHSLTQSDIAPNNVDPGTACESIVTIDWYWQTWVNGVLVNEEYLYSTQYCVSGGNGGASGSIINPGTVSAEELAESILDVMQNNTQATSNNAGNTVLEQGPVTRTAMYKWKCIRSNGAGGNWSVYSFEKGGHKKAGNKWQWQSLEHLSLSTEGTVVGGGVTVTLMYAQATIGLFNAIMNVEVQIDVSTTIAGTAYHRIFSLNTSKTFDVNGSPFLLPGY